MAKILDGKQRAKNIREEVKLEVAKLKEKGVSPKLAVILVGDNPASQIYVSNKQKDCSEVGILSEAHKLPATTKEQEIIELIESLNNDKSVHGILTQLPLPEGISEENVINTIAVNKDVDGLNITNMGMLIKDEGDPFIPCTPQGVVDLIKLTGVELKGKNAVVVGRSNIVGKPSAILLLKNHATVTICHSRSQNLGSITRNADILVVAIGKREMIKGEMVKRGAIVIDVGMNRTNEGLFGDVDFDSVANTVGYITPVPGGVGPMTRAMLLKNTIKAAGK